MSAETGRTSSGSPGAARLALVRSRRVAPTRDLSLRSVLDTELRRVRQIERAAVGVGAAWDGLLATAGLPAGVAERVRVVSFRSGVLTVRAGDASTKYALDRFLRGGGKTALARLAPTTLQRVKVTI